MNKKILVVDDDVVILDVIKTILEDKGYIVEALSDAKFVLEAIKQNPPAMIILDVWLGGTSGKKVARLIKKNTDAIPVVMISATHNLRQIAGEAGADDYLPKPFDISDLLQIVHRYTSN